jgi:hypothetical protein
MSTTPNPTTTVPLSENYIKENTVWCATGDKMCKLPDGKFISFQNVIVDAPPFNGPDGKNTVNLFDALQGVVSTSMQNIPASSVKFDAGPYQGQNIAEGIMKAVSTSMQNIPASSVKFDAGPYQGQNIAEGIMKAVSTSMQNIPASSVKVVSGVNKGQNIYDALMLTLNNHNIATNNYINTRMQNIPATSVKMVSGPNQGQDIVTALSQDMIRLSQRISQLESILSSKK